MEYSDLTEENGEGRTPLHCAAEMGQTEAVELLIDARADVMQEGSQLGRRRAYVFTAYDLAEAGHHYGTMEVLEAARKNLTIWQAAKSGDLERLSELVEYEDIDEQDDNGKTPLHYAAEKGRTVAVKLLIDARADITLGDSSLYQKTA